MRCPNCKTELKQDDVYCYQCGTKINWFWRFKTHLIAVAVVVIVLAGGTITGVTLYRNGVFDAKKDTVAEQPAQTQAPSKKENKTVYVNGIIEMNVEEHTVSVSGESICLTYKEYEILKIFLMHPGMAYTRNRLLSEVWGIDSYGETRTVDMHIKTLRQKLGDGGRYIVTVRNVGYKMEVQND